MFMIIFLKDAVGRHCDYCLIETAPSFLKFGPFPASFSHLFFNFRARALLGFDLSWSVGIKKFLNANTLAYLSGI